MFRWFVLLCLLAPLVALAAGLTTVTQSSVFETDTLLMPAEPQFVYGTLSGFPHTFLFSIATSTPFKAQLAVADPAAASLSLILVREADRGVVEIERMEGAKNQWRQTPWWPLGQRLWQSPALKSELAPGNYRLEVSAPTNQGAYELQLNDATAAGAWLQLRRLFAVHQRLGGGAAGAVLSPYIGIPLLLLASVTLWYYRRKRKQHILA